MLRNFMNSTQGVNQERPNRSATIEMTFHKFHELLLRKTELHV